MRYVRARNVNGALAQGLLLLSTKGVSRRSRAGDTIEVPGPVMTEYTHPCERVLFNPERDANPFFHLFEAIWMMAGREDVSYLVEFNKKMKDYSDSGTILRGAYGYRWRSHFFIRASSNRDQLIDVSNLLASDPDTRRAVLTMWDPKTDLSSDSKDIPCNTQVYFRVIQSGLETTVCCRSNDVLWGLYGSNAVHMSILHEWMASACGHQPGSLHTLSNSFHAYTEILNRADLSKSHIDHYELGKIRNSALVKDAWVWIEEAVKFTHLGVTGRYKEPFFQSTALPMLLAWRSRKSESEARTHLNQIESNDWALACTEWMERRWLS